MAIRIIKPRRVGYFPRHYLGFLNQTWETWAYYRRQKLPEGSNKKFGPAPLVCGIVMHHCRMYEEPMGSFLCVTMQKSSHTICCLVTGFSRLCAKKVSLLVVIGLTKRFILVVCDGRWMVRNIWSVLKKLNFYAQAVCWYGLRKSLSVEIPSLLIKLFHSAACASTNVITALFLLLLVHPFPL